MHSRSLQAHLATMYDCKQPRTRCAGAKHTHSHCFTLLTLLRLVLYAPHRQSWTKTEPGQHLMITKEIGVDKHTNTTARVILHSAKTVRSGASTERPSSTHASTDHLSPFCRTLRTMSLHSMRHMTLPGQHTCMLDDQS